MRLIPNVSLSRIFMGLELWIHELAIKIMYNTHAYTIIVCLMFWYSDWQTTEAKDTLWRFHEGSLPGSCEGDSGRCWTGLPVSVRWTAHPERKIQIKSNTQFCFLFIDLPNILQQNWQSLIANFLLNMNPNSFYKSSLILFVISDMVWHVHMYTCLSIYGKPISLSNFKSWLSLSSNLDRRKYRFAKTHCVSLNGMICIIHVRLSLEILELCQHFFSLL